MFLSDFTLKDAYIEGAKAAISGIASEANPLCGSAGQAWIRGHQTVAAGSVSAFVFAPGSATVSSSD